MKQALGDASAGWLRDEHRIYSHVRGSFIAELAGWHDGGETLLAIEDLTNAYWPPPWSGDRISAVLRALDELHVTPPPPGVRRLADLRDWLDGWPAVAADPEPLLGTGLCSRPWLESALPILAEASAACASRAGLPRPPTAPTVREFGRRQAAVALPWAARELGLGPKLGAS